MGGTPLRPWSGLGEDETGVTPPEAGYELYRHKNAGDMKTKNWHGLYWARRNKKGNFEVRTVLSSEGERSVPGGVFPKNGFEEYYEKLER